MRDLQDSSMDDSDSHSASDLCATGNKHHTPTKVYHPSDSH